MDPKKNPNSNIDSLPYKLGFIGVGLLFAAAIVGSALEATAWEETSSEVRVVTLDGLEDEEIQIVQPEVKPPPPPPAPTTVIEIVDDEEEIEEELEVEEMEVEEETEMEYIEEVEEEVVEDEIFKIVEDMPTFPGGEEELFRYLGKSIKYPAMARDAGITGVVYVTFMVDKDGTIKNVEVLRGIGGGCDEEAIRVIKKMPKWKAGKQRGKAVKVQFNLPIRFTLK